MRIRRSLAVSLLDSQRFSGMQEVLAQMISCLIHHPSACSASATRAGTMSKSLGLMPAIFDVSRFVACPPASVSRYLPVAPLTPCSPDLAETPTVLLPGGLAAKLSPMLRNVHPSSRRTRRTSERLDQCVDI